MMSIVQGMIDRRIISYDTGQKWLGLDPSTELAKLQIEKPLVLAGDLGVIGSPYNLKTAPPMAETDVQDEQKTPKGTPSEGRPKGKPAKKPVPSKKTKKPKAEDEELSGFKDSVSTLKAEELVTAIGLLKEELNKKL
jgi:hypothetical protein